MNGRDDRCDVVVVGAGAAGVGTATLLARAGMHVVVLERAAQPGARWLDRYERLRLHTARRYSHVAGARLRVSEQFVPSRTYGAHVAAAARAAGLDVRCGVLVESVETGDDGVVVRCSGGHGLSARHVVLATGQNDVPTEPTLPGRDSSRVRVRHAETYRDALEFAGRRVLVVGAGNTGAELAQDLAEHGAAHVAMSVRSIPRFIPRSVGPVPGHAIGVLLHRLLGERAMRVVVRLVGRVHGVQLRRFGLYPPTTGADASVPTFDAGILRCITDGRIEVVPALVDVVGDAAVLTGGRELPVDDVILATGYRPAAAALLPAALRELAGDLADPAALARSRIWLVAYGPAPLGQLVLAREHARLVTARIASAP